MILLINVQKRQFSPFCEHIHAMHRVGKRRFWRKTQKCEKTSKFQKKFRNSKNKGDFMLRINKSKMWRCQCVVDSPGHSHRGVARSEPMTPTGPSRRRVGERHGVRRPSAVRYEPFLKMSL